MATELERGDRWIVFVLKWGSVLATVCMLAGVVGVVAIHGGRSLEVSPPVSLSTLLSQLAQGSPYAVIQVGVLLLLLTPVLRLMTAVGSFWMKRERRYALVSFTVLLIIAFSLLLSRSG
jgi:uncharacterized membrane protein